MKVLRAVAMAAILVAPPAYAQAPTINLVPETISKTPEEKEQEAVRDKAYKDSLKKIPDAKGASDPWGTVRSADAPKSAPKPSQAKSRTKTGNAVN